ncbi:replication endonuclease [Lacimicrobium alkaliphilum]|uniref:replication endonuclease n=1 Tax=Lacimicrobium alkaliphilum TaxID=1526571 RepID=UPI001E2B8411|nr:replication endonuclease [Lacimicrobium alkaliphilum]
MLSEQCQAIEQFASVIDIHDRAYVAKQLEPFPYKLQKRLLELYGEQPSRPEKNRFLREKTTALLEILPEELIREFDMDEHSLRSVAKMFADKCRTTALRSPGTGSVYGDTSKEREILEPVYQELASYVYGKGLRPPEPQNGKITVYGCIRRMQDQQWWLRKLRKLYTRAQEEVCLNLNLVNRFKGIYASDLTVSHRRQQKLRAERLLSAIEATNELGQSYNLQELSDLNVSNPVNRKNELMTRMRGFENLSEEMGHKGLFVTITCPSKYHAAFSKSGQPNPKWQRTTPYQAQQYLCDLWARIRAELHRRAIQPYGFRVAEPQHDGTPHWHILLFALPEQLAEIEEVIFHYALQEDGDEDGAQENRCDFKRIDPDKGSATGYLAKYVSKNIDGQNLDSGVYGEDPIQAAQRVEAWASCWGIRQFQQIGGVSVTVWRELRRMKQNASKLFPELEEARKAADESKWCRYTQAMGGVFCKRREQRIRPFFEFGYDRDTGDIKTSWFDGTIAYKLKGVIHAGKEFITRIHQWQVQMSRPALL